MILAVILHFGLQLRDRLQERSFLEQQLCLLLLQEIELLLELLEGQALDFIPAAAVRRRHGNLKRPSFVLLQLLLEILPLANPIL